ncbi:MAG: DUF4157 domain-containing protein, partial [Chitinophagaceae bacterium]
MFSSTEKTTNHSPAIQQKAAGNSFFRKAGEQGFFGKEKNSSFFGAPVQPKLTVSSPDDPQEKEADAVADKVMRMQDPALTSADKKQEKFDRKEEEEVQAKQDVPADTIHCKECSCHKESQDTHIHRSEEEAIDAKLETGAINKTDQKNNCPCQTTIMRQPGRGPPDKSIPFEQTLASSKGEGSPLPGDTRTFMESRFNADFSGVRIHTDPKAAQLSTNVNAKAFAHGNDIYFNSGNFSPNSAGGGTLLAHELTHTIQQGASPTHLASTGKNNIGRKAAGASKSIGKNAGTIQQKSLPHARLSPHASSSQPGYTEESAGHQTAVQAKSDLSKPVIVATTNASILKAGINTVADNKEQPTVDERRKDKELLQLNPATKEQTLAEDAPSNEQTTSAGKQQNLISAKTGAYPSASTSSMQARGIRIQQKVAPGKNPLLQRFPSLGDVWDATGGKVVSGAKAVGNFAVGVAEDVIEWTGEKLEALINTIAPGLLPFLRGDIMGTIKEKVSAAIDSMTGGLFSQMQTEGFASIIQQLFGAAAGKIGDTAAQTCGAISDIAGKLWAFVKQLTGPALEGFKNMANKLGSFFSSVWNDMALPAWDAIKKFAGSAWNWLVDKANWLWDLTAPVRSAIGAAWDWVKKQFGIAWGSATSVIDWLKEKAAQAWNWVKSLIQPIIGPLKVIGAILVMLSPAGPIILIYKGAPQIWEAIKWLAGNFNKYVISTAKEYLHQTIIPAIKSGVDWIKGMIMSGFGWVKSMFDSVLAGVSSALSALAGLAFFKFLQNAIQRIMNGIKAALQSVAAAIGSLASSLAAMAGKIWEAVKPIAEIVRQLVMVSVLGPLAILDDGVWNTLNTIVNTGMKIPCVRELEGLMQVPWLMKQFAAFRQMMKGMYEMIKNPQPIINEIKKSIGGLVAKVEPAARAAIQLVLGKKNAHHLEGIMRHLVPKLSYLATNWWEVVKETGWEMLWPWPAFGRDCEQIWIRGKSMFSNFFHLHFSKGIDDGLAIFRLLNSIAGHLYGWFAIASVLAGTIIGAFFGGGGAIPGFWAGVGVAVEAGEVLLVGMLAAEGASIQKSVIDLEIGGQKEEEDEEDYEQISSSGLNLGIMGAMIVLGELAVKFGKSLLQSVKGLFKPRGAVPEVVPTIPGEVPKVEADVPGGQPHSGGPEPGTPKGDVQEVKGDTPEPKGDTPEGKGDTPEADLGYENGKKVVAEEPSPDGHKVKVTEDGQCLVCTTCEDIDIRYKEELKGSGEAIDGIKKELAEAKGIGDPEAKAKAVEQVKEKLDKVRAEGREVEPVQMKVDALDNGLKNAKKNIETVKGKIKEAEIQKLKAENPTAKKEIDILEAELESLKRDLEPLNKQAEKAIAESKDPDIANDPELSKVTRDDLDALRNKVEDIETRTEQIKRELDNKLKPVEEPAFVKENRLPRANETVLGDGGRFTRTGNV